MSDDNTDVSLTKARSKFNFSGTYDLHERIAEDATSETFAATHKPLGLSITIKFLKEAVENDPAAVEQFEQFIRAATRSPASPGFGKILDSGLYEDGRMWAAFAK